MGMSVKEVAGLIGALLVIGGVAIALDDNQEEMIRLAQVSTSLEEGVLELKEIHRKQEERQEELDRDRASKRELREEYCRNGKLPIEECLRYGIRPGSDE